MNNDNLIKMQNLELIQDKLNEISKSISEKDIPKINEVWNGKNGVLFASQLSRVKDDIALLNKKIDDTIKEFNVTGSDING